MQAVCSPIRNPLPRVMHARHGRGRAHAGRPASRGRLARVGEGAGRRRWTGSSASGPWYDNNLAILELRTSGLRMWWTAGEVVDGRHDRPVLRRVATVEPIG